MTEDALLTREDDTAAPGERTIWNYVTSRLYALATSPGLSDSTWSCGAGGA
jgi:hypothetical protein